MMSRWAKTSSFTPFGTVAVVMVARPMSGLTFSVAAVPL